MIINMITVLELDLVFWNGRVKKTYISVIFELINFVYKIMLLATGVTNQEVVKCIFKLI